MLRGLVLIGTLATLLAGCDVIGFIGLSQAPYKETVVDNQSDVAYVAEVDSIDRLNEYGYIAVPPHRLTVIDTQGEVNPPTEHVSLFSQECLKQSDVRALFRSSFYEGALITIGPDGSVSYTAKRTGRDEPTELDTEKDTCAEAAAGLP